MWPTFLKSHFPVIVHYSDLVINTTNNNRKHLRMFSFVVLPMNPQRGSSSSWCAEETTNVLFRPKWSSTDCSPAEDLLRLHSDDQISSLSTCQQEFKTYVRWYRLRLENHVTHTCCKQLTDKANVWGKTYEVEIMSHYYYTLTESSSDVVQWLLRRWVSVELCQHCFKIRF